MVPYIMRIIIFLLLLSSTTSAQIAVTSSFKRNVTTNEVDVYIIAGQSNAQGLAPISGLPGNLQVTLTGVKIYQTGTKVYEDMLAGTNNYGQNAAQFGPEVKLGKSLLDYGKHPYFIKFGVGGSCLSTLQPGGVLNWNVASTNQNLDILKGYIRAGLNEINRLGYTPRIRAFIWMQGESDAIDSGSSTAYQTNLENFISNVRSYVGLSNMPFVIGRINYAAAAFRTAVRTAQSTVGAEMNCYWIDTDAYTQLGDALHYDATGQVSFGTDIYNIVKDF